ncbi:immunoglobulin-like domain-containing protein [Paenibacillus turpanensis]|uniref:immunoglobulin-like domain-containing protein n=1 Tax=Paenibacillus turpanensis TaxID=2689078 RepID=UPI00140CF06B|nr:immunoglobulin-like domain-containing protein [Paenibacillus turpanensis]
MKRHSRKYVSASVVFTMALGILSPFGVHEAQAAYAGNLFFTQYTEGSGYNKAVEIYNGTSKAVDLSAYKVLGYQNGGKSPTYTTNLSGSIPSGETYVLVNNQAGAALKAKADLLTGNLQHNGNDVLVLQYNGTVIDTIGTVGSSANFGKDVTLFRNSAVLSGNLTYNASEWTAGPDDTADGFGEHQMDGFGEELGDDEAIAADLASLEIGFAAGDDADNVTQNITLITQGRNGTTVSWYSFDRSVVSTDGTVNRPASGEKQVSLIATVRKGSGRQQSKVFSVTVKGLDASEVYPTIASVRGKIGETVTIKGIVTADNTALRANDRSISTYLQDSTAGINIYSSNGSSFPVLEQGDEVVVQGEIKEYNGLVEIVPSAGGIQVVSKDNELPQPMGMKISQMLEPVFAERAEGRLVKVTGYITNIPDSPAGGGYNASIVDAEFNGVTLRLMTGTGIYGNVQAGKWYEVTAILSDYNGAQLLPRSAADFTLLDPQPAKPDGSLQTYEAKVTKVVDGDTIHLDRTIFGTNKVRFLSIDTPETNYEGQSQGYHAEQATAKLAELLPVGTTVRIEPGTEPLDSYGRLLAHVHKGDMDVNQEMVRLGMAVNYFIWPNMGHFEEYSEAAKEAMENGRGMFDPSNPIEKLPYEFRFSLRGAPDKFVGDYFTKEFVTPDKWDLIPTENRVFFFTEEEALEAGYTKVDAPGQGGVDQLAPVTYYSIEGLNNGKYVYGLKITLNATDAGSGVQTTEYKVNDGAWTQYQNPFDVLAESTHKVEYRSIDKRGNVENANVMDFDAGVCTCARPE